MGQSFVFALDHVEKEFVRIQQVGHPNSLEASTNSIPPSCSGAVSKGNVESSHEDEVDPYEAQAQLATNLQFSAIQKIVLPESIRVNTNHIAVLYCLDGNRDGVFSYDDLTNFVKWVYQEVPADVTAEDFGETVQAKATLRMWKECRQYAESRRVSGGSEDASDYEQEPRDESPPAAADYFVDWMIRFLNRNFPLMVPVCAECTSTPTTSRTPPPPVASLPGLVIGTEDRQGFPHLPDVPPPSSSCFAYTSAAAAVHVPDIFGSNALECLYELLNVRDGYGMTLQQFERVLQCNSVSPAVGVGEPETLLSSKADDQSMGKQPVNANLVRISKNSIVPLLTSFIRSYWRILSRLGLGVLL